MIRFKRLVVIPSLTGGLPPAELRQLVCRLLEENAERKRPIAELQGEIARLKGLKGRQHIKPGRTDKGTDARPGGRRGNPVSRAAIETDTLRVTPPARSRLRACEPDLVQDFVLGARRALPSPALADTGRQGAGTPAGNGA